MLNKNIYFIALCFLFILNVVEASEQDKQIILKINNVSDYRITFVMIALDSNGDRDTEIDAYKGELQVGQTLELGVDNDISFDIRVSSEADEAQKILNKKYGIETFLDISKGMIYTVSGYRNYAINDQYMVCGKGVDVSQLKGLKFIDVINGSDRIQRNANPLNGTLDLVNGVGLILKGVTGFTGLFRQSIGTYFLKPEELKKSTKGVRLMIRNTESRMYSGIDLKAEEFSKQRKCVFKLGTTRL